MKKKTLFCLSLLAALVVGLTACNTMQGVGKDIEEAGEAIQKKASH